MIKRTGQTPGLVATDRGYGEQAIDDALHALGVTNVVIPRKGRPGKARQAEERQRTFRRHVKWQTGCEGARIWTGHGVLTHNVIKISALLAA